MAKRKRQLIVDTKSQLNLDYMLNIAAYGVFAKIPLDHVGFDPYILEQLRVHRITMLGQLLTYSPASLRKKRYLQSFIIEILDALDEYFCKAFEEGKKAYYDNPLPIYKLMKLENIDQYRNYLLYDFKVGMRNFPQEFSELRAHGIITVYEFLKMNLVTLHEITVIGDSYVRHMMINLHDALQYLFLARTHPMPCPLDEPETQIITYPLPAKAMYKAALLTDDRIAGEEVSTEGLTPYEKALYDRSRDAIDLCGADFYYDVLDNREAFAGFAKRLSAFTSPVLELMQRKEELRNLYMAVPEKFRKMPARALYHYMVPRLRTNRGTSYCIYAVSSREVRFLNSWEQFHGAGRMASLEDCYRHLEHTVEACGTIEDFDKLMDYDGDWQFQDLLSWLANVSMLNAVYDNFLRFSQPMEHEATEEMQAIVPMDDPDDVIAFFARLNRSKKKDLAAVFRYYEEPQAYTGFDLHDRCNEYRYDFFAVYMLLTGRTSVPFKLCRSILRSEDITGMTSYFSEKRGYTYLYEYNTDTDTVTLKPDALQM